MVWQLPMGVLVRVLQLWLSYNKLFSLSVVHAASSLAPDTFYAVAYSDALGLDTQRGLSLLLLLIPSRVLMVFLWQSMGMESPGSMGLLRTL